MTPDEATTRIAEGVGLLARSLDQMTHALHEATRHLGRMIVVGYVLTFLALIGISVIVWQAAHLHEQTRTVVQTNQALLTELLGRTPRQP